MIFTSGISTISWVIFGFFFIPGHFLFSFRFSLKFLASLTSNLKHLSQRQWSFLNLWWPDANFCISKDFICKMWSGVSVRPNFSRQKKQQSEQFLSGWILNEDAFSGFMILKNSTGFVAKITPIEIWIRNPDIFFVFYGTVLKFKHQLMAKHNGFSVCCHWAQLTDRARSIGSCCYC